MPSDAWLRILLAGQTASPAWNRGLVDAGSPDSLVALPRRQLSSYGLRERTIERLKNTDSDYLTRCRSWLQEPGNRLVTIADPDYPQQLALSDGAPIALWIAGNKPELLTAPQIAMVGSRNATRAGSDNAFRFANFLASNGMTITSGLAAGIDAASHRGAINAVGRTVAVLGSGPDVYYPDENRSLAESIKTHGLIVSEYPPGTQPQRHRFPARNRIIAGLSLGVLVVEASRRSGSLITARFAVAAGREVFALPGSIHNPLSRGCHLLIREGAKLIEDAPEILVELAPALRIALEQSVTVPARIGPTCDVPDEHARLLALIGFDPTGIDVLVAASGLTTAEVSSMLLLLELNGLVEALPGGRYARIVNEA